MWDKCSLKLLCCYCTWTCWQGLDAPRQRSLGAERSGLASGWCPHCPWPHTTSPKWRQQGRSVMRPSWWRIRPTSLFHCWWHHCPALELLGQCLCLGNVSPADCTNGGWSGERRSWKKHTGALYSNFYVMFGYWMTLWRGACGAEGTWWVLTSLATQSEQLGTGWTSPAQPSTTAASGKWSQVLTGPFGFPLLPWGWLPLKCRKHFPRQSNVVGFS